tara:strand:- start:133 stop:516 length:384 start_codon:yes stop_codon:yes gene_type:complete
MNIEQQIKKIQNEDSGSIDTQSFINNLHIKRAQNNARLSHLINGTVSLCVLALLSILTVSQLAYEPGTFASTDLTPLEEMDAETESYVIDLATYLVDSSNDIWNTLDFFEEINFDNLIASNYGDIYE